MQHGMLEKKKATRGQNPTKLRKRKHGQQPKLGKATNTRQMQIVASNNEQKATRVNKSQTARATKAGEQPNKTKP